MLYRPPPMKHAAAVILFASVGLVAACSPAADGVDQSAATETPSATATATESPEPTATETPNESPAESSLGDDMQSVFDLEVGDCYDLPSGDVVEEVQVVDCDEPHDQEVIALVQHPAGPDEAFPGGEEIGDFADDECIAEFERYVGVSYADSELLGFTLMPTAETWPVGDREIVCAVYLEDGQLDGSVAGSER
jgi:hypothetical protein